MQIIVKLTTGCNLSCTYCSEGDKPLEVIDKRIIFKLIDEIPLLLDKYSDNNIEFLWHGGEPLTVGKSFLKDLMDYAKNKLQKYNLKFMVQTNGVLIDDEWINVFKLYNVGVGISLDGYKELHDKNRITKAGMPTFDIILENIRKLKKAEIYPGTLMVVNTANKIDVAKLFDVIKEYDLSPKIQPVIPCGRAADILEVEDIYDNYVDLLKELYKLVLNDNKTIVIEPLDEIMNAILGFSCMRECSFNGLCAKNFISVFADGVVSFCGRNKSNEIIYGNLKDNNILELYESNTAERVRNRQIFLQKHDCMNCEDWTLCYGGCSFEAFNCTGSLESKYPYCKQRKSLLNFLKTEGLELLKKRLLKEKIEYRTLVKEQEKLLEDLRDARK